MRLLERGSWYQINLCCFQLSLRISKGLNSTVVGEVTISFSQLINRIIQPLMLCNI